MHILKKCTIISMVLVLCLTACTPSASSAGNADTTASDRATSTVSSSDAAIGTSTSADSALDADSTHSTTTNGTANCVSDVAQTSGTNTSFAPHSTTAGTVSSVSPTVSTATVTAQSGISSTTKVTTKTTTKTTTKKSTTVTTKTQTVTTTTKPTGGAITPVSAENYFGLRYLKSQQNSAALVNAYRAIAACVDAMDSTVSLTDGGMITVEELKLVYACYRSDYPQHFWLGNSYGYTYSTKGVKTFTPKHNGVTGYMMTKAQRNTAQTAFDNAALAILSKLHSGMSEYERELAIHDAIIHFCEYDRTMSQEHSYSAYGALVMGSAVCEGYAKAFQYLLYQAGIISTVISGTANGESHGWNLVNIDGKWYHTDVTWDDPVSNTPALYYAYFNLTEAQIKNDHIVGSTNYSVPKATATAANYHIVNDSVVTAFSTNDIASRLKKTNPARVFVNGDVETYKEDLMDGLQAVMKKVGWKGTAYMSGCGNEIIIRLA